MTTALQLGSLFLGLIAWALPAAALLSPALGEKRESMAALSSFSCALSLLLQILYFGFARHWEDVLDTRDVIVGCALILTAGTALLNGLVLLRRGGKN